MTWGKKISTELSSGSGPKSCNGRHDCMTKTPPLCTENNVAACTKGPCYILIRLKLRSAITVGKKLNLIGWAVWIGVLPLLFAHYFTDLASVTWTDLSSGFFDPPWGLGVLQLVHICQDLAFDKNLLCPVHYNKKWHLLPPVFLGVMVLLVVSNSFDSFSNLRSTIASGWS